MVAVLKAMKVSLDEKGPTTSTRVQGLLEIKIRLFETLGVRAFNKYGLQNAVGVRCLFFRCITKTAAPCSAHRLR